MLNKLQGDLSSTQIHTNYSTNNPITGSCHIWLYFYFLFFKRVLATNAGLEEQWRPCWEGCNWSMKAMKAWERLDWHTQKSRNGWRWHNLCIMIFPQAGDNSSSTSLRLVTSHCTMHQNHSFRAITFTFCSQYDTRSGQNSGGALYIMFENHVRSWSLLKTP